MSSNATWGLNGLADRNRRRPIVRRTNVVAHEAAAPRPASPRHLRCRRRPARGSRRRAASASGRHSARVAAAGTAAARRRSHADDELAAAVHARRCAPRPFRRASRTRLRTIDRPRPKPPCARSTLCVSWMKRSKTRGSISAEIPMPVSRTRIAISVSDLLSADRDAAARLGVFGRIRQQIGDGLRESNRIAVHHQIAPGTWTSRVCRRCSINGLAISTAFAITSATCRRSIRAGPCRGRSAPHRAGRRPVESGARPAAR